jgi:hypothetical protein
VPPPPTFHAMHLRAGGRSSFDDEQEPSLV